jgi:hypothetical protein
LAAPDRSSAIGEVVDMNPLLVLALATPMWGFSLAPPTLASVDAAPLASIDAATLAQLREVRPLTTESDLAHVAHNNTMMDLTRGFQLAATAAMAVTGVLGFIQFGDEYGFHSRYEDTACATGNSVFDYCGRSTPWVHLTSALTTAGLGLTSFIMSTQVDFDLAGRIDGDWRTYEVTRWVGLGMFVVQALAGFLIANSVRFGWANEQGDFQTLQALAAGHMVWGAATLALETYNTILLF